MKLNRTYTRFFWTNLCIGLVALVLIFPFLQSAIRDHEASVLQESYQAIDKSFAAMSSDLEGIRFQTNLIRENDNYKNIIRIADQYEASDYMDIVDLRNYIRQILFPYNDIIYDFMLLFRDSDIVLSKNKVFLQESNVYPNYFHYLGQSEEDYKGSLFQDSPNIRLHPSQELSTLNREPREVVRYSIPLENRLGQTNVVLDVLFDVDAVYKKFLQVPLGDTAGIVLMDSTYEVIFSNVDLVQQKTVNRDEPIQTIKDEQGVEQFVFSVDSDKLLFRLQVFQDKQLFNEDIRQMIHFIMLYLLVSSGIFILIIGIASYWEYRPMKHLMQVVRQHKTDDTSKNPFDDISHVFMQTVQDKDMLLLDKSQLEQNLKELIFTQLLLLPDYEVEDPDMFHHFPPTYHGILIVSDLPVGRLHQKISMYFDDDALNGLFHKENIYLHEISSDRVFMVVDESIDAMALMRVLSSTHDLYLAVSFLHQGLGEIQAAYHDCILALHFRHQSKRIISINEFSFTQSYDFLKENWSLAFREGLLLADEMLCFAELAQIKASILSNLPEPGILNQIYAEIKRSILYVLDRQNFDLDIDLSPNIDFNCSIHQIFDRLQEHVKKICAYALEKKKSLNFELRDDMLAYIQAHFKDGQLYTRTVAEEFDLSEKYVSTFIKEHTGYGFSEYVEKLRLEHANELIRQTDLTMKQISELSGYNTVSTFYKSYKRVFGLSPGQMREV